MASRDSPEPARLKGSLKIFVAVPWLYGEIYEECLKSISNQDCPVTVMPPHYVKPSRKYSRADLANKDRKPAISAANVNRYIKAFLRTDATHMWMLDADCEVPFNALCELLKMDVDIASGVTFSHKDLNRTTSGRWYPPKTPQHEWSKPYFKFLTAREMIGKTMKSPTMVGTGAFCLLCKRRVFEPFHPKFMPLRFRWNPPQKYSIDLTFWHDAQWFGFTAAINGNILCGHLPEYPLSKLREMKWT